MLLDKLTIGDGQIIWPPCSPGISLSHCLKKGYDKKVADSQKIYSLDELQSMITNAVHEII
jgi:hypothetical protein